MNRQIQTYLVGDSYPPEDHILRDLAIEVETKEPSQAIISSPVTPHFCTQNGVLYAGVLAILADVVGGVLAVRAIVPDWLSTANMSLITNRDITSGNVSGQGRLMRCGRTSVIVGVDLYNHVDNTANRHKSVGQSIITYSRLKSDRRTLSVNSDEEIQPNAHFSLGRSPLVQSLMDKAGVHILDPAGGRLRIIMSTYVRNSLNSLQGGIIAFLADLAAPLALSTDPGNAWQTRDLIVHYMTPGIKGPFETTAEIMRRDNESALVRIEVMDCGHDNRLMAVIFNACMRIDS